VYGTAGSLALVLLWVYYAAQILFLGAEFTQVFSAASNSALRPKPGAMAVETVEAIR
jgi:membrane protein